MKYGATSTGRKVASFQAATMPSSLHGLIVIPSSIGLTTYTVYDTASGDTSALILLQVKVPAGDHSVPVTLPFSVPALKGLYFTMVEDSGSGVSSYVGYYSVG